MTNEKVKDIKPLTGSYEALTEEEKRTVNQFLTLREMTYEKWQQLPKSAQDFIQSLFPSVSK